MKQNNYHGVLQKPVGSGFNSSSTAIEIMKGVDLTGKIAIVTGGSSGIGLESVRVIAAAGATVIVAARDLEKAKKNLHGIANLELEAIDLAEPGSIKIFADKFLASERPLHVLINNAGIMWVPLRRNSRGIESQLATNYLGQFQLTLRLWPALQKAKGARVVNVSSFGHQFAPFHFEDPNFQHREYQTLEAYGQSKTASNLFTVELDYRGQPFQIRAYSLHPGSIKGTDLAREAPVELFQQMGMHDAEGNLKQEIGSQLKSIPQGAATTVWCATSPRLNNLGGVYCEDSDVAELDLGNIPHIQGDFSSMRGVRPYSLDKANAKRLWKWSERVTGLKLEAKSFSLYQ